MTKMKIGLIDVDGHNWPNLALMKISAWHKSQGDVVDWWNGFERYDRVYMSRVFDNTYTRDMIECINASEIVRGGTGYGLDNKLPDCIEHQCPDYSLYPIMTYDTAYGFLTRGCPRACGFCIVSEKEGRTSKKVADLSEFWRGEKNIKLLDPNLLAAREHIDLLRQLSESRANVDFTQGLDAQMLTDDSIKHINKIKIKEIHFAWDFMSQSDAVIAGLRRYASQATHKPHGRFGTVYVLTNFDTTMEENLQRVQIIEALGYDPYIMVYNKPLAPKAIKDLQRWVNNRKLFRSCSWDEYRRKENEHG